MAALTMPRYEYRCNHCGARSTLRRPIVDFDEPVECSSDGAVLERVFVPNINIHIPLHFRAVRKGGAEGGFSRSDFLDHSDREMAKIKEINGEKVEIVPTNEWLSGHGNGNRKTEAEKESERETRIEAALGKVLAKEA